MLSVSLALEHEFFITMDTLYQILATPSMRPSALRLPKNTAVKPSDGRWTAQVGDAYRFE